MTYQEQKQFRAARIEEIAALFPGATIELDGDKNPRGLNLGNEEIVYIGYNSWGAKGHRFAIHGGWPRSKVSGGNGCFAPRDVDYKAESPDITVSADKSAEQIKRDIERRFLPAYRALLVKCIAARDRSDKYVTDKRNLAVEFANLTGGSLYGQDSSNVSLPGNINGDIECSDDSVSFKIRSLSPERARELAALIAKWHQEDQHKAHVALVTGQEVAA